MSTTSLFVIAMVSVVTTLINIVVTVHLITAVVSSELKCQRDETPDPYRTFMWAMIWLAAAVITITALGIASTL